MGNDRSNAAPIRRARWEFWVAGAGFVLIAAGHAAVGRTTHQEHLVHVVFRAAYLAPVILCAFAGGIRGGIAGAAVASLLFVSHVLGQWGRLPWENANQLVMVAIYWLVGPLVGVLLTSQRNAERMRRVAEESGQREVLLRGLEALQAALGYRDEHTARHGAAVGELAGAMAERLGLGPERVEVVRLAGRVHDLGKIGIRDDVLLKPSRLSREETERMHAHPNIAADILSAVPGTAPIARVVRAHHEYLDGSGYPLGLRGDQVPLEAQIVTAADVFSAVTEVRSYHQNRSVAEALEMLDAWVPARLPGEIVAALRACVTEPGSPAATPGAAPAS